jgi:hypothetical protein
MDAMNLLSWEFDDTIRLFDHILTSFFCFNGQFCEQMDRVATGCLL